MDLDKVMEYVMYGSFGILILLIITAIITEDRYEDYKYRVKDSEGCTRGCTNKQPNQKGCLELNTGKICGTYFMKLNTDYKNYKGD